MSADGAGLVLNCVFSSSDGSKTVDYVQRLNSGRAKFEQSRAAAGAVVAAGTDAYWIPAKTQLLALDGNDLVAILFQGVQVDLPTAKSMLVRSLALRDRTN
jgi:hypothetical protein